MTVRVKRPKVRTKCEYCGRRRDPKFIEWWPGVMEWRCSDITGCVWEPDRIREKNAKICDQEKVHKERSVAHDWFMRGFEVGVDLDTDPEKAFLSAWRKKEK